MLKKILLSTLFLSLAEQNIHPSNNDQLDPFKTMLAGGVVGCAVTWMIAYSVSGESNSSIIDRLKTCIQQHRPLLDSVRVSLSLKAIKDVPHTIVNGQKKYYFASEQYENELLAYKQLILAIQDELVARYNNLLTPWNWSGDMKVAISDIKNIVKDIDQLLYRNTLQRIESFNHVCGYFISDIISSLSRRDIILVLAEQKINKDEIQEFLKLADSLTAELSKRSSKMFDMDTHEAKKIKIDLQILKEQARYLYIIKNNACLLLNMQTTGKLVEKVKRFSWDSSYLFVDVVYQIFDEIDELKSMDISSETYVQKTIQLLREVNSMLISSDEYRRDRRAYDSYLEQKRQREAAEKAAAAAARQAQAAREAAEAAERQARAAEERNRIERERNELERRKQ